MKEFVEKLISRLEESKNGTESEMNLLLDREYLLPCSMNQIDMEEYRVSTFEDAISIVNQLAEEYNNGWIPCSERLPDKRDWYLAVFQEADTGFVGIPFIADYLMGVHTNYTTEDGWIIANCTDIEEDRAEYYKKLKCIAWQPLPAPFVQK